MGFVDSDPLAIVTAPPPGELPEEKAAREKREAEAQRISDRIDDEIKLEKAALKKRKSQVKVLLLGQSESGKSTTLKNFRLKYARAAWKQERASWRAVIQLNLLRSIITIVETLQSEMDAVPIEDSSRLSIDSSEIYNAASGSSTSMIAEVPSTSIPLTDKHQLLKLRLGPLRRVEADLMRRLGAGADEVVGSGSIGVLGEERSVGSKPKEFCVRGWKHILETRITATVSNSGSRAGNGSSMEDQVDEATEVIATCREDMKALWTDEVVRDVLKKRRMRLEDSAGFFLNDLDRIATRSYEPSDDDIVRARLRTLGVQEHKIQFDQGSGSLLGGHDFGQEWILYDVGGARTLRHAWLPYFDNVNAIIFLAPISCFDERLLEDPSVNRLEDSFLLWRAICSSEILKKTTLILFLNKCDLLKRKLRSGAEVREFLPSFGDRPNDPPTVVKYLREKFKDILRQHSPEPRVSYFYATSVTDTKATATTLKTVRDSILREHLKSADFV